MISWPNLWKQDLDEYGFWEGPQPPLNQGYNRWRLTFQTWLGQFESSLWGWPFSKPISLVIRTPSLAEAPSATQMEFYLLAGPGSLGLEAPCGGDSIASNLTPGRWKSEVHDIQTRCPHAAGIFSSQQSRRSKGKKRSVGPLTSSKCHWWSCLYLSVLILCPTTTPTPHANKVLTLGIKSTYTVSG